MGERKRLPGSWAEPSTRGGGGGSLGKQRSGAGGRPTRGLTRVFGEATRKMDSNSPSETESRHQNRREGREWAREESTITCIE